MRDIARSGKQLIHVGHSVVVDRPFTRLSEVLVEAPRTWFPRSIGVHFVGIPIRKRVNVEFGDAVRTSTWAVIRVSWKATFPQRLFPILEGKVSLSPAGKDGSKLTVSGVYEPPLGRLGEDLNEAVLHGIAERTVEELAESVAKRLKKAETFLAPSSATPEQTVTAKSITAGAPRLRLKAARRRPIE